MSIFNDESPTKEIETSFMDLLVKEKGDKFRDPETLAKSKLEADRTIAELKAKLKEQEYSEQILAKLNEQTQKKPEPPVEQTAPKEKELDLDSLIESHITSREKRTKEGTNLKTVEDELERIYGDKSKDILKSKAKELGVSLERMEGIAKESPTAFFSLIGQEKQKVNTTIPTSVNSAVTASSQQGVRNNAWYNAERRKDPKLARDPQFYAQMMRDASTLGDKFFK